MGDITDAVRPIPYDYTCFADDTSFVYEIFRIGYCIRGNCNIRQIFLNQMEYRLQSMYNHMVGRTASVI